MFPNKVIRQTSQCLKERGKVPQHAVKSSAVVFSGDGQSTALRVFLHKLLQAKVSIHMLLKDFPLSTEHSAIIDKAFTLLKNTIFPHKMALAIQTAAQAVLLFVLWDLQAYHLFYHMFLQVSVVAWCAISSTKSSDVTTQVWPNDTLTQNLTSGPSWPTLSVHIIKCQYLLPRESSLLPNFLWRIL